METYGARILVVGDSVDASIAERMRPVVGPAMINKAGACTVRQSAALLSLCHAFIGNDSGPMHLAAASDVPVIELSCHPKTAPQGHINSPQRYAPLSAMGAGDAAGASFRRVPERGAMTPQAHCILNLHLSDVKRISNEWMESWLQDGKGAAIARG